jgi:hypothetical protein
MKILILFAICLGAWAQSGIDRPSIGKMVDQNGALRTVYGISGSVTLGDVESVGVLSSACSKSLCLAKTEASISSGATSVDAPAGPAKFAFDGPDAFVWFPKSRQLGKWHEAVLDLLDSSIDGEVLSIRAHSGAVEFVVRRHGQVWIVRQDGAIVEALPGLTGPVMLLPKTAIYATDNEIVMGEFRFPLVGAKAFAPMSDGFVQIRAHGIDYALRIDKGHETLFQLPGVQQ